MGCLTNSTRPKRYLNTKKRLFSNNWCGIAFGSDIPDVGDIKALEFINIPLIIVRTEKEQIHLENVCRHRE